MSKNTILITGGAGFIGSNFIRLVLDELPDFNFINIDKLTYSGNIITIKPFEQRKNYKFIKGDISNYRLVKEIFDSNEISAIINFAAETHVDRSILNPNPFMKSNILGTQVLLEVSKNYHLNKFIQISTDEVYGSVESGSSKEDACLLPNSPYSSSKASADLLCRAYNKTFGVPVLITRCSNNYGPYQYPEKLIPVMILNAYNGSQMPVYGNGENIRDWIHVNDHCRAVLKVMIDGVVGEIYNISGNNSLSNIELVNNIAEIVSGKAGISLRDILSLITFVKDRPAHDFRYCMDTTKINNELGWVPEIKINHGLEKTVDWYLSNTAWIKRLNNKNFKKYYRLNYLSR